MAAPTCLTCHCLNALLWIYPCNMFVKGPAMGGAATCQHSYCRTAQRRSARQGFHKHPHPNSRRQCHPTLAPREPLRSSEAAVEA